MDTQTFLDNFATIADAPGGVQRLREMVINLALQGRLTDPDPADEPVDSLLPVIDSEREEAFRSNGWRSGRSAGTTREEELPWPIPDHWAWVRLERLALPQAGFAFKSNQFNQGGRGMPLIRIRDIGNGTTECHFEGDYREEFIVRKGDYLVGMDGNFNIRQWQGPPALLNQRVTRLIFFSTRMQHPFVTWALQDRINALHGSRAYTTVQHLSGKQIAAAVIPVPPLAEQERIVAKVDELLGLCDDLEARQERSHRATTRFRGSALHALTEAETPDDLRHAWERVDANWPVLTVGSDGLADLRTTILQLAVRGRLVPQLEHEISPEVRDLTTYPVESTKLWELPGLSASPTTWSKLPMASLGRWGSGGTPAKSHPEYYGGDIPWVVIGDLNDDVVTDTKDRITEAGLAGSAAKWIPAGSVLIAMYGASIGKTGVAGIDCTSNQAIAHCVPNPSVITTDYMFVLARTLRAVLTEAGKGAAQPNISQQVLKHLIVGVPPLGEQERIVKRLEQLTRLCDSLGAALVAEEAKKARVSRGLARTT
jgi:type I restriction enzyme, S subunit